MKWKCRVSKISAAEHCDPRRNRRYGMSLNVLESNALPELLASKLSNRRFFLVVA
jgi:hypothetical protein